MEKELTMKHLLLCAAVAVVLVSAGDAQAARLQPTSGTMFCRGEIKVVNDKIDFVFRGDNDEPCNILADSVPEKLVMVLCGVGNHCSFKAYGTWERDFYVKRIIGKIKSPGCLPAHQPGCVN
jgi:hypothetical protein